MNSRYFRERQENEMRSVADSILSMLEERRAKVYSVDWPKRAVDELLVEAMCRALVRWSIAATADDNGRRAHPLRVAEALVVLPSVMLSHVADVYKITQSELQSMVTAAHGECEGPVAAAFCEPTKAGSAQVTKCVCGLGSVAP